MLGATPEHVLACLAEREDKALRLIRRNAARLMARRRNIILPILHGCVLTPVKMYNMRRGGIGYVNTAYAALVLRRRGMGSDIALQNGDIIHSLWTSPTVERLVHEGRAVHFKQRDSRLLSKLYADCVRRVFMGDGGKENMK